MMSRTLKPLSLERDVREHPKVPHAPRDFLIVFKSFFRKPYVFWLIGIFFIYLALAIAISGFYNTIPLILRYAQTVNWLELGLSIVFSLIIGALVAFNLVAVHLAYKERQACREAGALTTIGTIGGLAAGICPLCVTGLFPLVLGLLGITFSFATLPFKGIEVQALSIVVLWFSLWMVTRRARTMFK